MDRLLFAELRAILPSDGGSIRFLRDQNFAGWSFRESELSGFRDYLSVASKPDFEFMDAELESLRAVLTDNVRQFLLDIAVNTWHTHRDEFIAVPEEWEHEQPKRFHEVVKRLHDLSDKICENYDELIRAGRRRLAVP